MAKPEMTEAPMLPCPFCNGDAAIDRIRSYRSIVSGALGRGVAIYCSGCGVEMMHCYEDHPGVEREDLQADLVAMWNSRMSKA